MLRNDVGRNNYALKSLQTISVDFSDIWGLKPQNYIRNDQESLSDWPCVDASQTIYYLHTVKHVILSGAVVFWRYLAIDYKMHQHYSINDYKKNR